MGPNDSPELDIPDRGDDKGRTGYEYYADTDAGGRFEALEQQIHRLKERRAALLEVLSLAKWVDCDEDGCSLEAAPEGSHATLTGTATVARIRGSIEELIEHDATRNVRIEYDPGHEWYRVAFEVNL